ncbi:MAG: heat-inducible transcription repressor HrcA [Candidatus Marinimicrobia bacterium]|nr:heat-inducible transcription repressor HrcA [Candidatus Neomarinimicrobiota bacterium]
MSQILIDIYPREQRVLKAVVEDYILSNVPIGSNFLKNNHTFNCSPATLRNTMASLEKKQLLMHTHTSSGRIPTDLGYRYYVDHLMEQDDYRLNHLENVENELASVSTNLTELLQTTAAMLSKISHLFGVTMILQFDRSILQDIELVSLSTDRVMVVLGMKSGMVRSIVLNLEVSVKESDLHKVADLLQEKLLGLTLKEIQDSIILRMKDSPLSHHEIIQILLTNPKEHFSIPENQTVYMSSTMNLLNQPENQHVENLQKTLIAVDSENITHYFKTFLNKKNNYLFIGKENLDDIYNDCTIVTNVFGGSLLHGQIGIIGPTRIPYAKITGLLNQFTEIMNRVC